MQLRFNQKLQNHIPFRLDIRTVDIEYFLNLGQNKYIDELFLRKEDEEFYRKRIGALYDNESITVFNPGSKGPNSYFVDLPLDCKYVHENERVISDTGQYIKIIAINRKYYNTHYNNPFAMPYEELGWRLDAGERMHELILADGITPQEYNIDYVRVPNTLVIADTTNESEVSPEFHDEIVDKAVEIALQIYNQTGVFRAPEQTQSEE